MSTLQRSLCCCCSLECFNVVVFNRTLLPFFNMPYLGTNILYGGHLTESRWFPINQYRRKSEMRFFCRAVKLFYLWLLSCNINISNWIGIIIIILYIWHLFWRHILSGWVVSDLWVKFGPLDWAATFRRCCRGCSGVDRWGLWPLTNKLMFLAAITCSPVTCNSNRGNVHPRVSISSQNTLPSRKTLLITYAELLTHIIIHCNTVWINSIRIGLILIPFLYSQWGSIHPP